VKEKITNTKQGWIIYLESLEKNLLENVQGQKDKFARIGRSFGFRLAF
jgi:hypothetical protein